MTEHPTPGWYTDPGDASSYRWWDGEGWTDEVSTPLGRPASEDEPTEPDAQETGAVVTEDATVGSSPGGGGARRRLGIILGGIATAVLLLGGGTGVGLFLAARDVPAEEAAPASSPEPAHGQEDDPEDARADRDPEPPEEARSEMAPTPGTAAVGGPGDGWTVVIESLEVDRYSVEEVEARATQFRDVGIPEAAVLLSDEHPGLNPGFWVVYAGHWDAEDPAAEYCRAIRDLASQCYPRQLAGARDVPASNGTGTSDSLAAAEETVRSRGFDPVDTSGYDDGLTLQVIVGSATGSATGRPHHAFFFVEGRFIGTDTLEPSASVQLSWQDDTTVALTYATYDPADAMCCPSGSATVRYFWDGAQLTPLDPIPTNDGDAYGSRR